VCVLRYRRHHFMARGIHGQSVGAEFLVHSNEEQGHADLLAARIVQLGGEPDFAPDSLSQRSHAEYVAGDTLAQMIQENLVAERIAIDSYRDMVRYLGDQDPTTSDLLKQILAVEEEHADELADLLEGVPGAHARCGLGPDLYSCKALVDATVEARDGEVGHVQDLIVDDDGWAIRYLVVSASDWWLGHDVLVAPPWIQRVSWPDRSVSVDLTREALKQAPWYDPAVPLSREMEVAVYRHHGRTGYWPGAAPATPRVQA
jgi:bacterioferritin